MIRTGSWLFALVCAALLAGCSESETAPGLLSPEETASPIVYEITAPGGAVEGWMLGTIHALPDENEWRHPRIEAIINDADTLLVEVAGLDNSAHINEVFTRLSVTPGLGPLPPRIDPELRGALTQMIALSQFPESQFDSTESWAAAIMLAQVGAVGDPRAGVDRALIADFRGRNVVGFEGAAEQLGIFDRLPPDDQQDLLEGTVREWMASRSRPGRLTRAWLIGDEAALEMATTTGIMADKELRDALLVDRNRRWMPALLEVIEQTDRVLVAVGTAHIVGPDGLPAMLRARGYGVRRVE